MDVQHALLSKVILHRDFTTLVNARVTVKYFTDERYQRVFNYITKHWQEYRVVPDEAVMLTAFPTMEWVDDPQPIEYFIDQLKRRRKKAILTEGLSAAANFFQSDDPDAVDEMERTLQTALINAHLETATTLDENFTEMGEFILQLLEERMLNPGYLRGISTGFDGIDYVTGGLQPEHFIVLIGTPKSFKSATLLAMALAVHRQNKKALFIGFEMNNTEQRDRTLSLVTGVSLSRIMSGTLNMREHKEIERALEMVKEMEPLIFTSDISATMTVSGIQAKAQEYQPDVIFVDGAYLMQSEMERVEQGSPQALTNISRSLKRLAQSMKLPVVVTTQASLARTKGGAVNLHSAMYTQAWGQDSDIFLGVDRLGERQEDESLSHDPVAVRFKVIESRSGPRKQVVLEWDWHKGAVQELDPVVMRERLSRKPEVDDGTGESWKP